MSAISPKYLFKFHGLKEIRYNYGSEFVKFSFTTKDKVMAFAEKLRQQNERGYPIFSLCRKSFILEESNWLILLPSDWTYTLAVRNPAQDCLKQLLKQISLCKKDRKAKITYLRINP